MNIANWLHASAATSPLNPALLCGVEIVSNYAEFAHRSAMIASNLHQEFGVEPGDRVVVLATNSTDYLEFLYGIWWAGAVAVPVNAKLHQREAIWIIENSGAKIVFASDRWCDLLAHNGSLPAGVTVLPLRTPLPQDEPLATLSAPILRTPSDFAWLFYTSGTTGRPKGAILTHGNLVAMSLSYLADVDRVEPGDAALYAAPMSHGAGLYNFIHVRAGARHVVPSSGEFDPHEILALAQQLRDVSMFAAPTMVRRLVNAAEATGSGGDGIRTIVYGGGPMYLADIEHALGVLGQRFVQIYGQGESPMTITALSRADHAPRDGGFLRERLSSVGRAQSCVDVCILGENGEPLRSGLAGEIAVRGPTVMAGYWENAEATASTIRDGWLLTGDIGRLDGNGYLTLTDRTKDVIITGGSNVYPREVEEVLLTHPDVAEVAVVGRPNAEWGEEVVACVVPTNGGLLDEDSLDAICVANLARFKRPKRYLLFGELPKNNYGKVLKTELRAKIAQPDQVPTTTN